jgi:Lrp/AsnC family transcriptional regulator, leucine-responsive regulatory protein
MEMSLPKKLKSRLDALDARIIEALAVDARVPMSDLARATGMSGPSITERVRKLEASGVIRRFTIELEPKMLGYTLEAIVRIKPRPGQLHQVEKLIQNEPRFVTCDKVTGEDCFIARLLLMTIEELDALLDGLHVRAETNTAIIKSSPVKRRMPPLIIED